MDSSPSAQPKARYSGERTSSSTQLLTGSVRRTLGGRKTASLSSLDNNKSANIFSESPHVIDYPGQHCVRFLTLLPHQEKLFYLNLFQRKNQYSSNPISHIEHRTKSHVFMEMSAFDSPVCRIQIAAKEKRNIERVLELLDEYCPVLLKYSNHQELTRVRQSLLAVPTTPMQGDVTSAPKLPTLRRVPSVRRQDSGTEKSKSLRLKLVKQIPKAEKKPEQVKIGDQPAKVPREKVKEKKKRLVKEDQGDEMISVEKEKLLKELLSSVSHSSHEAKDVELEKEKTVSSFEGDAVNNEVSVLSAIESLRRSEREVVSKPPLPMPKMKPGDYRKGVTPAEIYQELETVVEGYLEREREKVEKMKMEAAEPKSQQKALEKFRELVRNAKPQKKMKKEKEKSEMEKKEKKKEEDKPEGEAQAGGDDKGKKPRRRRRKAVSRTSRPGSQVIRDSHK